MVLKKSKKDNNILFIDASKECIKAGNNNQLTEKNISDVVSIFENRKDDIYAPKYKFIGIALSTYIIIELDKEIYIIEETSLYCVFGMERKRNDDEKKSCGIVCFSACADDVLCIRGCVVCVARRRRRRICRFVHGNKLQNVSLPSGLYGGAGK